MTELTEAISRYRPIVVIGSINMDLVCRMPRLPIPGETILATDFSTIPGGKGANQAVAAARLSAPETHVYMVGRVGDDDFGRDLIDGLVAGGVRTEHVGVTSAAASGCAIIQVDERGENTIAVVTGANGKLTPGDVDAVISILSTAAAVVLQLEVPLETVRHAIEVCRRLGIYTILDPAPVPPGGLPPELYDVDLLTPNQVEARLLAGAGTDGGGPAPEDSATLARVLLSRGPRSVVLKLGGDGAIIAEADQMLHVPPFRVEVVDTTAAGDAFTAALAVARAEGRSLADAVRFANAAGALCCQRFGAQPALPRRAEVNRLLAGV